MADPAYDTAAWPWVVGPDKGRTPGLWVAANDLPRTGGHPFYQRWNATLDAHRLRRLRRSAVWVILRDEWPSVVPRAGKVHSVACEDLMKLSRGGRKCATGLLSCYGLYSLIEDIRPFKQTRNNSARLINSAVS
jgi:hypothetical protein